MNKAYKIIKPIMLIVIVLLGIIGILSLYNAMYKQLKGSDYAFLFDYSTHEVIEDNMSPTYNRGDLIIIKRDYIYNEGDNIVYNYNGNYRIATITSHTAGKYVLSDKLNTVDNEYEINDGLIIGKTVSNIKNFAKIYNILTSTYMMVAIIIFIGAYFFLTMNEKPKTYI